MSLDASIPILLVPGAWMGGWIWDGMVDRLHQLGHDAHTITLPGCGTGQTNVAEVTLADHVDAVVKEIESISSDGVVLVAHSYSGVVVGQVADRLGPAVKRSIHVGSFLPRAGRSLLDDWGDSDKDRAAEKQQVIDDGGVWAPPPPAALEDEADLTPQQRAWLAERFVPHPGRTVTDPAAMTEPITSQPITYIATAPTGGDPLASLPPEADGELPDGWELKTLSGGHWPMLTAPIDLARLIDKESSQ